MRMVKHSQSFPSIPKIASLQSLQYLKNEVRDEADFLLADKLPIFHKLILTL